MNTPPSFTSPLGTVIADHLVLKRALGREYVVESSVFTHLDRFLGAQPSDGSDLTAESFARWSATLVHLTPTVRRNRMRIVRNLCLYRRRYDPHCFVPDTATFPRPHVPVCPYLFTEQDIVRLLRAAASLRPSGNSPLHGQVFRLAIVLLFTAGLRRGELVRLVLGDYDVVEQTLLIRATKFHKSRVVPLSRDAAREMDNYLQRRRTLPHAVHTPLLCNRRRGLRPYTGAGLGLGLRQLFRSAGVTTPSGRLPRVHDMRHSFALNALLRWYRAGDDVQVKLPALASYMGHVSIVSTRHYLSQFEPLAAAASARFARHCESWLVTSLPEGGER